MPKAWAWVLWRAKNRGLRSRAVSITGVLETIGGGQPPRPGKKPRLWDRGAFEEKGRKIAKGGAHRPCVGEGAGQLRAYPRTSALSLEEPTKIPTFAWAGPVNNRAGTPVRGRMPLGVGHSGPQRTPSARPRSRALAWHGAAKPLTEKIKGMVGAG